MSQVAYVKQHAQPLCPEDEPTWLEIGRPLGISAYEAKAYYTIGLVREMVATAGLARSQKLHLGAIFQVLDAIELLGRAVGGFRHASKPGKRMRAGLRYVLDLNSQEAAPLVVSTVDEYTDLRNFTGHGAASSGRQISFDPWTGLALLHMTTRALDAMWANLARAAEFAMCQIDPLSTASTGQREAIYVRDVQTHLREGKAPSAEIPFDEWRREPVAHRHRVAISPS